MELKEYQKTVLNTLNRFLSALHEHHSKYIQAMKVDPDIARDYNFPEKAWTTIGLANYRSVRNGLGEALPNIVYKVPTGGGKTLLATHSIDSINKMFLNRQTGMVLWIVPTTQIYSQTIAALRDRNHHLRQLLDISSGGRTLVLEKTDVFTKQDVEEHLCIMLLMLPSAARQSKETLKVFKDNSGYTSFFPVEDDYKGHTDLMKAFPNLDTFGEAGTIYGQLPLTSLGNTLRILRPVIIIDEGHKAYSETARSTIYGFNPSFLLELSATPPDNVNKLVIVSGKVLNDEQMIKLDIHLTNKATSDWKNTVTDAVTLRASLEQKATEYEQNTNKYIRPIMLVQVERTGKDQREAGFIHSEDVKEYLIKQCAIPEACIAIKSSEKDDIENIDLLARGDIKFIITKQALQEGWDCPFAYILCALANSQSEVSMTQLIGRVLRQPYAVKTGIKELDECYVYTCQYDTARLVRGIKQNLEGEGLGDIAGRMVVDDGSGNDFGTIPERKMTFRPEFQKFIGRIFLPVFAILDGNKWRGINYQTDILSNLRWQDANLSLFSALSLENTQTDEEKVGIGLTSRGVMESREEYRVCYESTVDTDFVTRQLLDVIPNPWIAFELATKSIEILRQRYDTETIASNIVFIIEELRKLLFSERDRLSEGVFRELLKKNVVRFYLLKSVKTAANPSLLPSQISVRSQRGLYNVNIGQPLQRSLFDYIPADDLNSLEQDVALYLDGQQNLLWWYRNIAKAQYRIQGWKPNRVYPDFIATRNNAGEYDKVFVLESKGKQLEGNEDTTYKRSLLDLCSSLSVQSDVKAFEEVFKEPSFVFQMIDENTWRSQINELLTQ